MAVAVFVGVDPSVYPSHKADIHLSSQQQVEVENQKGSGGIMKTIFLSIIALLKATQVYANHEKANFRFMLRGYCYAESKIVDPDAPGGFGGSNNLSGPIGKDKPVRKGEYYLIAQPKESGVFAQRYKGTKLLLINATKEKVAFPAQDSRLYIIQEAKDENGEWRPIEYLPSSWCGNSYHQVFLEPNKYWSFTAPRYGGSFKTKLRFKLEGDNPIYSNEFEGSINKEQFSIKQGHHPTSIMDPYYD